MSTRRPCRPSMPRQSTLYDAAADLGRQSLVLRGRPLHASLNDQMLTLTAAQMDAIPEVIAIPYGNIKRPAVQAALRGGLVNSPRTHTSLVTALLRGPARRANAQQAGQ
jgi:DNA-binding transcriptional regulator LsrR (DeoR family)